jgi:hypothetical protein
MKQKLPITYIDDIFNTEPGIEVNDIATKIERISIQINETAKLFNPKLAQKKTEIMYFI